MISVWFFCLFLTVKSCSLALKSLSFSWSLRKSPFKKQRLFLCQYCSGSGMTQGESDFSSDPDLFVDLGSLSRILASYEIAAVFPGGSTVFSGGSRSLITSRLPFHWLLTRTGIQYLSSSCAWICRLSADVGWRTLAVNNGLFTLRISPVLSYVRAVLFYYHCR